MAKKKKTYFQAISYTTDHCDGDLIAPSCWKPEADRAESANQIMQELGDSFGSILATKANAGPDSLTIDYKSSTDDDIDWSEPKTIKNWKRASQFLDKIRKGLTDGTISTRASAHSRCMRTPAHATDGAVLRRTGSARMRSGRTPGSCSLTSCS